MMEKSSKIKALLFTVLVVVVFFVVLTIGQLFVIVPEMFKIVAEQGITDVESLQTTFFEKEGVLANAQFVGEVVITVVMALWYYFGFIKKEKKEGTYESVLKKLSNKYNILFMISLFIVGSSAVFIIFSILNVVIPDAVEKLSNLTGDVSGNALGLIAVIIGAPLSEELCIRGIAMKKNKKAFGIIGCMLISAIFFAILHANIVQGLYSLPLGLVYGFLAYRYNSIIPSVIGHVLHNGLGGMIYSKIGVVGMVICLVIGCAGVYFTNPKKELS